MPWIPIRDEHFSGYPREAREVVTEHIELLRTLPVVFVQLLLQQIQSYDWRFPAERQDILRQLTFLESLTDARRRELLAGFERLELPSRLRDAKWIASPQEFSEQLSGYLWSTHQIDAFRDASSRYLTSFGAALPARQPQIPRIGVAVIGNGVAHNTYPIFRKLRPHGAYFTRVNPTNGLEILLEGVTGRAAAHPVPFDHWYIDGGDPESISSPFLSQLSYGEMEPVRRALLRQIDKAIKNGIAGPEALTSLLHKLRPEELGASSAPEHTVLSHFQISLLTEGAGTQIFSTTFVQWATRELWRRAQPETVLARFAPRQRERPMNELLSGKEQNPELDPIGSLIDADMGAFYMWINQQRLPGAKEGSFLAWFENQTEAVVISPAFPRNSQSDNSVDMKWLFTQIS
ncbi:MAG TPA: hypothetical protein VH351_17260 [Bryobacteraceae bacterium]|jgi:hypothetical protein|nr:hypothetical protein [Bryobacteraceae bacterium]